jgi:carbon-monoxide dehydrogenase small subunit
VAEKHEITLRINGEEMSGWAEPRMTLADFVRDELKLTGTHLGCEHGVCGACTILVDGRSVRSCLMFAVQAQDHELITVEGLASAEGALDAVQQAFSDHHALQCGFCTPGFLMTVTELLDENPDPDEDEIRVRLSGNLCRCTGYENIVEAVKKAAETVRAEREQRTIR